MITIETIKLCKDEQLSEFILAAQAELKERAEQRKREAMEQIRQIAVAAQIDVRFAGPGGRAKKNPKAVLKAGERYVHPGDATKSFTVGKGRPPAWFTDLQRKGKLPRPELVTK